MACPFLIDPSSRATEWLRTHLREHRLEVINQQVHTHTHTIELEHDSEDPAGVMAQVWFDFLLRDEDLVCTFFCVKMFSVLLRSNSVLHRSDK